MTTTVCGDTPSVTVTVMLLAPGLPQTSKVRGDAEALTVIPAGRLRVAESSPGKLIVAVLPLRCSV
ncbi:MAG: hypothetical protein KBI28_10425 [Syntrophaceae bacterium]|nr:hypothetical protein [Syntrophaceae bacterium]